MDLQKKLTSAKMNLLCESEVESTSANEKYLFEKNMF